MERVGVCVSYRASPIENNPPIVLPHIGMHIFHESNRFNFATERYKSKRVMHYKIIVVYKGNK